MALIKIHPIFPGVIQILPESTSDTVKWNIHNNWLCSRSYSPDLTMWSGSINLSLKISKGSTWNFTTMCINNANSFVATKLGASYESQCHYGSKASILTWMSWRNTNLEFHQNLLRYERSMKGKVDEKTSWSI
jgi:hypothetical protein